MDQKNDTEKKGLFIPTRQVSALVALAISLLGVVFMAGYFFGKKQMVDQFVVKAEQDSFADQIYASLCALYDQDSESIATMGQRNEIPIAIQEEAVEKEDVSVIRPEKKSDAIAQVSVVADPDPKVPSTHYYAQLIGYGTKKAADSFVQKLQKKGVSALVKTRRSQTAKGRKTTWYQVVTKPFSDRKALESLTQSIAQNEKIKGIRVIAC